MKKYVLLLILSILFITGCGEDTLTYKTALGNKIQMEYKELDGFSIKIPLSFRKVSQKEIKDNYKDGNAPSVIYVNNDGSINISVIDEKRVMKDENLANHIETYETLYKNHVEGLKSRIIKKDGRKIGLIEMVVPSDNKEMYNSLAFISVDGKLKTISFYCSKKNMKEWKGAAKFILESIKFD